MSNLMFSTHFANFNGRRLKDFGAKIGYELV